MWQPVRPTANLLNGRFVTRLASAGKDSAFPSFLPAADRSQYCLLASTLPKGDYSTFQITVEIFMQADGFQINQMHTFIEGVAQQI